MKSHFLGSSSSFTTLYVTFFIFTFEVHKKQNFPTIKNATK